VKPALSPVIAAAKEFDVTEFAVCLRGQCVAFDAVGDLDGLQENPSAFAVAPADAVHERRAEGDERLRLKRWIVDLVRLRDRPA
jgi:hypothetical protein